MRINFPSNIHIAKQLASRPATKSFAAKMSSNMPPAAVSEEDRKVTESSGISATFESIGIKNTQINEKPGVSLDERRKVLVGSVLDVSYTFAYGHTAITDMTGSSSTEIQP